MPIWYKFAPFSLGYENRPMNKLQVHVTLSNFKFATLPVDSVIFTHEITSNVHTTSPLDMYLRQQSSYITAVASWCEKSALSPVNIIFMTLYIWNLIPGINSTMSALSNEYLLIAIGRSVTELWPVKVRRRLHCEKYKSSVNTNCAYVCVCVCVHVHVE